MPGTEPVRPSPIPFAVAGVLIISATVLGWSMGASLVGLAIMGAAALAAILVVGAPTLFPAPPADDAARRAPPGPIQTHHEFANLFDAMIIPLLIIRGGRVDAANVAARNLLGDFIVGADVRAAIRHPAAADLLAAPHDGKALPQPRDRVDLVGIGAPGERWQMQSMPLTRDGLLVALTDRTAQDAVDRMRSDFVANASHELRTPLASIIGFAETLADPDAGGDADLRARFLGLMGTEARRMQQLVEDLLSVSRIEASRAHFPDSVIDIADVARTTVAQLQTLGTPRSADIRIDAAAPVMVYADRAQIGQMIDNIVSNAMKYGRGGTPVAVSIGTDDRGMARIAVSDQGDGIPADQIPRLTERFYRVDSARSRSLGGTGLGLAIVKHIVERHRGRLAITSEEGAGTTVEVRLPLA